MAEKDIKIDVCSEHRKRVKENVKKYGLSHLEEYKLLELLLFYSIPRKDTKSIAKTLINYFGSLEDVFNASAEQLQKVDGIGENTAIMLTTVGQIFYKISTNEKPRKRVFKTTDDLKEVSVHLLGNQKNEKVLLLCFNAQKVLKRHVVISEGDKFSSEIDMKLIIKNLVDSDSSIAVLAHNHPTSSAEPSAYDIDSTRMVCVTLRKIGYALADHIIVGENGEAYSMHLDPRFSALFY